MLFAAMSMGEVLSSHSLIVMSLENIPPNVINKTCRLPKPAEKLEKADPSRAKARSG
jgi:hypothetical protein